MNLTTARIFVRDLEQARRFYADTLGLKLVAAGMEHGYCVFDAGGLQLVVESVPDDAPEDEQVLVGRFTGLSFSVADVAQAHRSLLAAGVAFTGEPERQAWGGTLATLRDPAGNQLQIVLPP
ncbi:MAG: VOC family protein [Solirubrobacteraceae bacterium]|nr:VOC family protein [Solirubrobacteraceae bacterium]